MASSSSFTVYDFIDEPGDPPGSGSSHTGGAEPSSSSGGRSVYDGNAGAFPRGKQRRSAGDDPHGDGNSNGNGNGDGANSVVSVGSASRLSLRSGSTNASERQEALLRSSHQDLLKRLGGPKRQLKKGIGLAQRVAPPRAAAEEEENNSGGRRNVVVSHSRPRPVKNSPMGQALPAVALGGAMPPKMTVRRHHHQQSRRPGKRMPLTVERDPAVEAQEAAAEAAAAAALAALPQFEPVDEATLPEITSGLGFVIGSGAAMSDMGKKLEKQAAMAQRVTGAGGSGSAAAAAARSKRLASGDLGPSPRWQFSGKDPEVVLAEMDALKVRVV